MGEGWERSSQPLPVQSISMETETEPDGLSEVAFRNRRHSLNSRWSRRETSAFLTNLQRGRLEDARCWGQYCWCFVTWETDRGCDGFTYCWVLKEPQQMKDSFQSIKGLLLQIHPIPDLLGGLQTPSDQWEVPIRGHGVPSCTRAVAEGTCGWWEDGCDFSR